MEVDNVNFGITSTRRIRLGTTADTGVGDVHWENSSHTNGTWRYSFPFMLLEFAASSKARVPIPPSLHAWGGVLPK